MSLTDNPLAEAFLLELRGIRAALEKTADAYTRVAKLAESKQAAPPTSTEPKKERKKVRPEDILTVTGYVSSFGQAVNAANNEPKVTKNGKTYWTLKLTNGFFATVFSESQAALCSQAFDEGRPLIIEYVKQGNYSNIESMKLGGEEQRGREPGEDDDESPF